MRSFKFPAVLLILCLTLSACGESPAATTVAETEPQTTAAETTEEAPQTVLYTKTTDLAIVDGYDIPATSKTTHAMQGMTLFGEYLYCVKVNGNNDKAAMYRVNRVSGEVERMTSDGEEYVNWLGHANDLCAVESDGKLYLFVSTMKTGLGSILQVEVKDAEYSLAAKYNTTENGEDLKVSGIDVLKREGDTLTFLMKSYNEGIFKLHSGELNLAEPKSNIRLTYQFTFDASSCWTGEKIENLKSWTHQSIAIYDGRLLMPLTELKQSYLIVIDLYDENGNLISGDAETVRDVCFMLTSDEKYSSFEAEAVAIDENGVMYVNSNRKENGMYKDDGIHTVNGFIWE